MAQLQSSEQRDGSATAKNSKKGKGRPRELQDQLKNIPRLPLSAPTSPPAARRHPTKDLMNDLPDRLPVILSAAHVVLSPFCFESSYKRVVHNGIRAQVPSN